MNDTKNKRIQIDLDLKTLNQLNILARATSRTRKNFIEFTLIKLANLQTELNLNELESAKQ
jgi:hypothetical protein